MSFRVSVLISFQVPVTMKHLMMKLFLNMSKKFWRFPICEHKELFSSTYGFAYLITARIVQMPIFVMSILIISHNNTVSDIFRRPRLISNSCGNFALAFFFFMCLLLLEVVCQVFVCMSVLHLAKKVFHAGNFCKLWCFSTTTSFFERVYSPLFA